jgi:hypothetical protein
MPITAVFWMDLRCLISTHRRDDPLLFPNTPPISRLLPHVLELQVQVQEEGFHEDFKEMAG